MYTNVQYSNNTQGQITSIRCDINGVTSFVPIDPANTDYQKFKLDIESGVELQDPDGNIMTPEEVSDFLKTLP